MRLQAGIYLGAAVLMLNLSVRLGLGSVLGYLAAGILVGPMLVLTGGRMRRSATFRRIWRGLDAVPDRAGA